MNSGCLYGYEFERPGRGLRSMAQKVTGRTTIRTAAVLFLASAVFEIMEFNSAVAIFGGVRV